MNCSSINAVYIHIPFCKKICHYCDFCKVYYQDSLAMKYLMALEKEIKDRYQGDVIKTLYIGGGTPSVLSKKELIKLFSLLKLFKLDEEYEFTMEANIESLDEAKIKLMKENGVNRVSIGIETISKKHQQELGRVGSKEKVRKKIALLKKYGIENINVDMMYGFCNQTEEELKEDLDFFLSLDVPHLSLYSLMIEDNTILKINHYKRLQEDMDASFYYLIEKKLKKEGYLHYEISNYAKKGYQSKHNLVYWNNKEYYGFGASSASYIYPKRFCNTKSVKNYINGKREVDIEILTKEDVIFYQIMLNLRKKEGINKKEFYQLYHKKLEDVISYKELVEKKVLQESKTHLSLSEGYTYVLNEVLVELFQ